MPNVSGLKCFKLNPFASVCIVSSEDRRTDCLRGKYYERNNEKNIRTSKSVDIFPSFTASVSLLMLCGARFLIYSSFPTTVEPPIPLVTTQKIHERLSLTIGQTTGNQFLISPIS